MNLKEACDKVSNATLMWNEAVIRYGELRQDLYELQAVCDRMDKDDTGNEQMAQQYMLIASKMDDIRDASSDLTFNLGEMANTTRQFARILANGD